MEDNSCNEVGRLNMLDNRLSNVEILADNLKEIINNQQKLIDKLQDDLLEKDKILDKFSNIDIDLLLWIKEHFPLIQSKLVTVFDVLNIQETTQKLLDKNSKHIKQSGIVVNDKITQTLTTKQKLNIRSYFIERFMDQEPSVSNKYTFQQVMESPTEIKDILREHFKDDLEKPGTQKEMLKRRANCVYSIYKKNIDNILDNEDAINLFKLYKRKYEEYKLEFENERQELLQNQI